MEFIDLHSQYCKIKAEVAERIQKVLEHKKFIMGPEVDELEKRLSSYVGRKYAVTCSNGTDALVMSLMAMGVKEGDAVFVPAFTFFSSGECVNNVGAVPVFVDVDPVTFNIDLNSLKDCIRRIVKEGRLTAKGIIAVDLFGLAADYNEIRALAAEHNLFVIEDGAQGFGGIYCGKKACSFGEISTTSFFPAKPFGCYGDGGAIFTDDDILHAKLTSIRVHGQGSNRYDNVRIGMNGRLDTIQAAILLAKLNIFDEELKARNRIASFYNHYLKDYFETPVIPENRESCWAQYTLKTKFKEDRDFIIQKLEEKNIPVMIYYGKPLHLQKAYEYLNYKRGDLPVSEKLSDIVFSIPMHPYLKEEEMEWICKSLIALDISPIRRK